MIGLIIAFFTSNSYATYTATQTATNQSLDKIVSQTKDNKLSLKQLVDATHPNVKPKLDKIVRNGNITLQNRESPEICYKTKMWKKYLLPFGEYISNRPSIVYQVRNMIYNFLPKSLNSAELVKLENQIQEEINQNKKLVANRRKTIDIAKVAAYMFYKIFYQREVENKDKEILNELSKNQKLRDFYEVYILNKYDAGIEYRNKLQNIKMRPKTVSDRYKRDTDKRLIDRENVRLRSLKGEVKKTPSKKIKKKKSKNINLNINYEELLKVASEIGLALFKAGIEIAPRLAA